MQLRRGKCEASGVRGLVHGVVGLFYAHAVAYGTLNWPTPPQYEAAFGAEPVYYNWNDFLDVQKATFGELNIDLLPGRHGEASKTA